MADGCAPGRRAFPPAVPADDGTAVAGLVHARSRAELLAALVEARVFAAVSATSTAEEVGEHGLRAESTAEMAVLLLSSRGERALPVFSSVAALEAWRPDARPVPLTGAQACQAALDESAVAVVLDPAGAAITLSTAEIRFLAAGFVPVTGSGVASRHAEVSLRVPVGPVPEGLVQALRSALRGEGLRAARLLEGPDGLVIGVAPRRPLEPAALAALAQRVMGRLGDHVPPQGLDLAQVGPRGAGLPVLRGRRGR